MEYYSATKKMKTFYFATKWMEMWDIMLGELSQIQKRK